MSTKPQTYNTNPKTLISAGVITILLFFGGLGGIAATMPFSGAVIVPGVVKVSSERKVVQHLEGGIIEKICVKDGDQVKAGELLIKLKSPAVEASLQIVKSMLAARTAEADRLIAEKDLLEVLQFRPELELMANQNPDAAAAMIKEKDIFAASRNSLKTRRAVYHSQIDQLNQQITGAAVEFAARQRIADSLTAEIADKEPLVAQHYIDATQIQVLKRQLDENLSLIAAKQQAVAQSRARIDEIKVTLLELDALYREKAALNLSAVEQNLFELRERLIPSQDASTRLEITAPVSGTVVSLQIHTEQGGIIRSGEPLLEIVPVGARLIVEGQLRQDKITQVQIGQSVRVSLSAFNRVTTPPIKGRVIYVSADSVSQQTPQGVYSSYTVRVEPDSADLKAHDVYLLPGMPAACFIETEQRTFLQYLIEPITLNIDRALRETL